MDTPSETETQKGKSTAILKPKLDVVFKYMFADEKNKDLLKDFLAAMLDVKPEKIKFLKVLNAEITPEQVKNKFITLDVRVEMNDEMVDIEMQTSNKGGFQERTLFYWARMYSDSVLSGENYKEACKCYTINILNYKMFRDVDDYHSVFSVLEKDRHTPLSDKLEIHFFELPKVQKIKENPTNNNSENDKPTSKELWLNFLNSETEGEFNMLREKSEIMGKAVDTLYGYSGDEKVRYLIQARQQALFDEKNALSTAKKEGRAEGEAKGRIEGRAEGEAKGRAEATAAFVKNLKAMGMSEEEIRKALSFADSKADDEIEDEDDEDYEPEM